MSRAGVIDVAVGAADGPDPDAAIVVCVDRTAGARPQLPERIEGVRVTAIFTDPFVAYWLRAVRWRFSVWRLPPRARRRP